MRLGRDSSGLANIHRAFAALEPLNLAHNHLAMTEGLDLHVVQITLTNIEKDSTGDFIRAERADVLLEAESAEPECDFADAPLIGVVFERAPSAAVTVGLVCIDDV